MKTRLSTRVCRMALALFALACVPCVWPVNEQVLHSFQNIPDGSDAIGGLVFDSAGDLYGTTYDGGAYGWGCIFELTRNKDGNWTESILYSFTGGTDGRGPEGALVFDAQGNLYGTTVFGGTPGCGYEGCGTVFRLSPNSDGAWTETVLSLLNLGGRLPGSSVVFDTVGDLYGTGSYDGCGEVFQLVPTQSGPWAENIIYSFTGPEDGCFPTGITRDTAGNLYVTTYQDGFKGWGTAIELSPNAGGWTGTLLHTFEGGKDGLRPLGPVTLDNAGNVYGSAQGGVYGGGVVFMLTPTSNGRWKETVYPLKLGNSGPNGGLVFDNVGNLYGTSWSGLTGMGTVFRLSRGPDGGVIFKGFSFDVTDGFEPSSSVILDSAGNLYGTTDGGGNSQHCGSGCGTVYEIIP
jgi:uncharacterized repeat protein (TIGR03803 family)